MRLKELRDRVKAIAAYKAEAQAFHDDVDDDLNDALAELWTSRIWTFRVREGRLLWMPDVTVEIDVDGPIARNDERLIEEIPSPANAFLYQDAYTEADEGMTWVGQTVEVLGRDYEIQNFPTQASLMTTEPVRFRDDDTSPVELVFKQYWAALPVDCAEVLSLASTDSPIDGQATGPIDGLPMRVADSEALLRMDVTGNPECYIPLSPLVIPPGGKTTLTWNSSIGASVSDTYGFGTQRYYEITWAFERAGRFGPLAEPATIQVFPSTTVGNIRVNFLAGDATTAAITDGADADKRRYPLAFEGYRKVLFVNSNIDPTTGDRLGRPCWRRVTRRAAVSTENEYDSYPLLVEDTAAYGTINQPHQVSAGNPRLHYETDGHHPRVRLYPRPSTADADYPLESLALGRVAPLQAYSIYRLRYLARPPLLIENGDTPPMPGEFHQILTWMAGAALLRRCGDEKMARTYEERAAKKVDSLTAAHTVRVDLQFRMGSWGRGRGRGRGRLHPIFERE